MKTEQELKKLNKERLLAYYKSVRTKMFTHGYRLADGFEDPQYGQPIDGWMNYSLPEEEVLVQVNYLALIKEVLRSKGHVDKVGRKNVSTKIKGNR